MTIAAPHIPLRSWIVLISIGILLFLTNIDYTAVNLTLVPIAEEINTDLNHLQWLLSAYVLVWAALVIPAGRIADLYGKYKTLNIGLLLFMAGSCITGLGQSIDVLIFGRVLQGIGAAAFTAPAWASIVNLTPPGKQGFVMGIILSFCSLGLAIGPTIAGFIIEEISWRWIYYINIPLGIMVITALMLYAPKDILPEKREKIDFLGSFLLASSLSLTVYALNQIEVWGVKSMAFWAIIAIGLFFGFLFILRNKSRTLPMVPSHLFRNKPYMAATLGEFFMAINFSMILVLMALYLQNTLHYSTYETGLIFIAMTVTMGCLSPVGGKLVDRFGVRMPMVFGALITAIAMGMMAFLGKDTSLVYVLSSLFLAGAGLGMYFTAGNTAMLWAAPPKEINVASGVYMMFMMMGNTLSIILSTSLVVLFGRTYLLTLTQKQGLALSLEQHQNLTNIISQVEHSASQLTSFSPDQIPLLLRWVDDAFVHGLSINMMLGSVFSLGATLLTLWGIVRLKAPVVAPSHAPVMV